MFLVASFEKVFSFSQSPTEWHGVLITHEDAMTQTVEESRVEAPGGVWSGLLSLSLQSVHCSIDTRMWSGIIIAWTSVSLW